MHIAGVSFISLQCRAISSTSLCTCQYRLASLTRTLAGTLKPTEEDKRTSDDHTSLLRHAGPTLARSQILFALFDDAVTCVFDDVQLFSGRSGEDEARQEYPLIRVWTESTEPRVAIWHVGQALRAARPSRRLSYEISMPSCCITPRSCFGCTAW